MIISFLMLLLASALLYFGADGLVGGSARIAFKMGIKPLIVGLTIVAFGTSSPELVVSINANLAGSGDITLGNVIGSNICNIGLIVGITALIKPINVSLQIVRKDIIIMCGVSVLPILMLIDGQIGRIEGVILILLLIVYLWYNIFIVSKQGNPEADTEIDSIVKKSKPMWMNIAFIIGGLALLIVGANLFVEHAVEIARFFNISESVIGLTIVAIGTSLPELATSVVASIKGESDISLGNIVGSNIFNILAILGIAAVINPINFGNITYIDLSIMMMFAVVLLPLARTGFIIDRKEGFVLLLLYVGYIYILLR
ncbi:MAG: sodium:calcium antiporter [Ignavibacteriae bacterium HGW-Ignavibacteriae-1]|jgi:cation:H+ antiporter|nr:MAG: sodium:calcium antiporter [Ignavibacteriae bacterium HGW-Ignavibacteriae-1]